MKNWQPYRPTCMHIQSLFNDCSSTRTTGTRYSFYTPFSFQEIR